MPVAVSYTVQAALPPGWSLLTTETSGTDGVAVVALHLSEGAAAGPRPLTFTLRTTDGVVVSVPLTVTVAAHPDFVVVLPATDRLRPGEGRKYTARITNTGNATDTLRLRVEGSATVSTEQVTLAPGESAEVQLAYTQRSLGNADTVRLTALSTVEPGLTRDSLLVLSINNGQVEGGGPQLNWSAALAPQVNWNSAPKSTGTPETGIPDLPGSVPTLPGLPDGNDTPETATPTLKPDAPTWTWGGTFNASLGGDLSDYARGSASYSLRRAEDGQMIDRATVQVIRGDLTVRALGSNFFRQLGLEAEYGRGDYSYGVGVYREAAQNGQPAGFSVAGRLGHTSGLYLSASHRFVDAGTTSLDVGWRRQLGAWLPSAEVSVRHAGSDWGVALRQRLNYENKILLAQQDYRYDSLSRSQQLDVRVGSRQQLPFGINAALSVSNAAGVWRYGVSGAASYRPDPTFGVTLQANAGSDRFSAQLSTLKEWRWGSADVFVSGQLNYEGGVADGVLQATGVLPAGGGALLLRGTLGYRGAAGLLYGAGAGYIHGAFSVAGGAQSDAKKTILSFSAAYRPARGVSATADYLLSNTEGGSAQTVRASVGYNADRWSAAVLGGYGVGAPQNEGFTYGARVGVQVIPSVQLSVQAERTGERTRVSVRGNLTPSGAFKTPDAVVNLFGGRDAGTLQLLAFLDGNKNGVQDAGEAGIASRFMVGEQVVATDERGSGSTLLKPGKYNVQLEGDVLAQYLIPSLPEVAVPLRQTVTLAIPVQQVGTVQGQLTDDTGHPLAGVPLQLNGPEGSVNALTDATGFYRAGGLGFGTYDLSVQADPALYRAPEPFRLVVDATHVLITQNLQLESAATLTSLSAEDLTLSVTLPQQPVPPGAVVPVRAEVESAADAVHLEGLGEPLPLTSLDGRIWSGTVKLAADQQTTEVQVVAQRGTHSGSERAILLVDPALPAATLRAVPYSALPAQILTLRTVLYVPATQIEVRDETGQLTPLLHLATSEPETPATVEHQYTAQFTANTAPGTHTLTLLVDGQVRAQATYQVLGRP
ncbi:hypothetical protein [Deinococcus aerolatus]|uniref:hypothetical protein n=1 Tax=Deinococcus aerolatus TaxID=522487 RepID=UPI0016657B39|nr:hypothetical protein [Deinococcus aerolatus]